MAHEIEFVDGLPVMRSQAQDATLCFPVDGHLTPEGHQIVAQALCSYLNSHTSRTGREQPLPPASGARSRNNIVVSGSILQFSSLSRQQKSSALSSEAFWTASPTFRLRCQNHLSYCQEFLSLHCIDGNARGWYSSVIVVPIPRHRPCTLIHYSIHQRSYELSKDIEDTDVNAGCRGNTIVYCRRRVEWIWFYGAAE